MVTTPLTAMETASILFFIWSAALFIGGALASFVLMCSGKYLAEPYDGDVDKDKPWVVRFRPMHKVMSDRVSSRVSLCILSVFNLLLYIWLYAMYVVGG